MRSVVAWYRCRPARTKKKIHLSPLYGFVFVASAIFTVRWFVDGRASNGFETQGATLYSICFMAVLAGLLASASFEVMVRQPLERLAHFAGARLTKTDRDRIKLSKLKTRQARLALRENEDRRELQESVQTFLSSAEQVGAKHGFNVLESALLAYELLELVQEKAEAKA